MSLEEGGSKFHPRAAKRNAGNLVFSDAISKLFFRKKLDANNILMQHKIFVHAAFTANSLDHHLPYLGMYPKIYPT